MGKIIELNKTFMDLLDPNVRIAESESIQSISESPAELAATFRKNDLASYIKKEGGDGVRFYPAMHNNELIMVAVATNGLNDLVDSGRHCLACNIDGPVPIESAEPIDEIPMVPLEYAGSLIRGEGSEPEMVETLNRIRQIELSPHGLKVLFDQDLISNMEYDNIFLEVVDLKLSDTEDTKRSIHSTFRNQDENVFNAVSMLPCPPNCGDIYANSI